MWPEVRYVLKIHQQENLQTACYTCNLPKNKINFSDCRSLHVLKMTFFELVGMKLNTDSANFYPELTFYYKQLMGCSLIGQYC